MVVGDGVFAEPKPTDSQIIVDALTAVNRDWSQDDWAHFFLQEFFTVEMLNEMILQIKGGTFEAKASKILGMVPTFAQIEELRVRV